MVWMVPAVLRFFLQIFDVVLEDEKIRLPVARQTDEGVIVILHHPHHLFAIDHLDPHRGVVFDKLF